MLCVVSPRKASPAVRSELIAAAAQLLAQEGPTAFTLRRVAGAAGTTTMAIYTHFGSMDELKREVRRQGYGALADAGLETKLVLQIHDELLFEVPRDEVERLAALLRETMEGALPLSVPLVVDVKVGDNWESMTPLTREDAVAAEADELPLEAPIAPLAS